MRLIIVLSLLFALSTAQTEDPDCVDLGSLDGESCEDIWASAQATLGLMSCPEGLVERCPKTCGRCSGKPPCSSFFTCIGCRCTGNVDETPRTFEQCQDEALRRGLVYFSWRFDTRCRIPLDNQIDQCHENKETGITSNWAVYLITCPADPTVSPTTDSPSSSPTASIPSMAPSASTPSFSPSPVFPSAIPSTSNPSIQPTNLHPSFTPTMLPSWPIGQISDCISPEFEPIHWQECPTLDVRQSLPNCQDPESLAYGDLCEADLPILRFPDADNTDNCGAGDVFRLEGCFECHTDEHCETEELIRLSVCINYRCADLPTISPTIQPSLSPSTEEPSLSPSSEEPTISPTISPTTPLPTWAPTLFVDECTLINRLVVHHEEGTIDVETNIAPFSGIAGNTVIGHPKYVKYIAADACQPIEDVEDVDSRFHRNRYIIVEGGGDCTDDVKYQNVIAANGGAMLLFNHEGTTELPVWSISSINLSIYDNPIPAIGMSRDMGLWLAPRFMFSDPAILIELLCVSFQPTSFPTFEEPSLRPTSDSPTLNPTFEEPTLSPSPTQPTLSPTLCETGYVNLLYTTGSQAASERWAIYGPDGHMYCEGGPYSTVLSDSTFPVGDLCCLPPGFHYNIQTQYSGSPCSFNIDYREIIDCGEEGKTFLWDPARSMFPTMAPTHILKDTYAGLAWLRSTNDACRRPWHEEIEPQTLDTDGCVQVEQTLSDGTVQERSLVVYCWDYGPCYWGLGDVGVVDCDMPDVVYGPLALDTCTELPEFPGTFFYIGDPHILIAPSMSPTTDMPTTYPTSDTPSKSPSLSPSSEEPSLSPSTTLPSCNPTSDTPTKNPTGSGLFISSRSGLYAQRDLICAEEGGFFSSPADKMEHDYLVRMMLEPLLEVYSERCEGPFVNVNDYTTWNRWPEGMATTEPSDTTYAACYDVNGDGEYYLRQALDSDEAYFVCEYSPSPYAVPNGGIIYDLCAVSGDLTYITSTGTRQTMSGMRADFSGIEIFTPIVLQYFYMGTLCQFQNFMDYRGRYALVEVDGSCTLEQSYANAIAAEFEGVIFFLRNGADDEYPSDLTMSGVYTDDEKIPAVAITVADGSTMKYDDTGSVQLSCGPLPPTTSPTFTFSPSLSPTTCEYGFTEVRFQTGNNPELESFLVKAVDDEDAVFCYGGPYPSDTPYRSLYTYQCCLDPDREVEFTMTPNCPSAIATLGGLYRFPVPSSECGTAGSNTNGGGSSNVIGGGLVVDDDLSDLTMFPSVTPTFLVRGDSYGGFAWLRSTDPNHPCDLPFYEDINRGKPIHLEGHGCQMVPYTHREGEHVEEQMRSFRVICYSNNDCYWGIHDEPDVETCDIETYHGPIRLNTCNTYDEHSGHMFFIGKDVLLPHPSVVPSVMPTQMPHPSIPSKSPSITDPSLSPSTTPSIHPSTLAPTDISGLRATVEIDFRDIRDCNERKMQLSEMRFFRGSVPIEILDMQVVGNNHPYAGEFPMRMTDGDTWTKWVEKDIDCTGYNPGTKLVLTLTDIPYSYVFTTANDAPERDPVTWSITICRPNYAEPGETCVGTFVKDFPAPIERETDYPRLNLEPVGPTQLPSVAPVEMPNCDPYAGNTEEMINCLQHQLRRLQREAVNLRQEINQLESKGETCDSIVETIEDMACASSL